MAGSRLCLILAMTLSLTTPALSQSPPVEVGGDLYVSGSAITRTPEAGRDVLAMGASVTLTGNVTQDAHVMGFDVEVDGAIGGDLTAAGGSVSIDGPVSGDVTAAAISLRTGARADIGGNARLAGATVNIVGPVAGALIASGSEIVLDAPVSGDAVLTGAHISFGPDARIDGVLSYSSPDRIEVPERVASADRVRYEQLADGEMWREARDTMRDWDSPMALSPWKIVAGFLVNLALFVVIGALFLWLAPKTVLRLRDTATAQPGLSVLMGFVGLSILFGSVPVSALTIVGLPMVPILILVVVVVWALGYILGAYVLAMRAMQGFGMAETPGIPARLLALAIGVTLVALLNFIPIIGWIVNLGLVFFGVGAITTVLFRKIAPGLARPNGP